MDLETKVIELEEKINSLQYKINELEQESETLTERVDDNYVDIGVIVKILRKKFPEEKL